MVKNLTWYESEYHSPYFITGNLIITFNDGVWFIESVSMRPDEDLEEEETYIKINYKYLRALIKKIFKTKDLSQLREN
jgi:hypothetical protein